MIKTSGLPKLEKRVAHDLSIISYPVNEWIPPKFDEQGQRVLDVLVVGGGQGGLTIAFQLLRERVQNIRVIDAAEAGQEGPWLNYARMPTLRSPKEVNGPDLNIPSLAFQAWYEAQFGKLSWKKLNKIPTELWVNYLKWFRKVLSLPVQNKMKMIAFEPSKGNIKVKIKCLKTGDVKEEITRKLILATGIETPGRWSAPPISQKIPKDFWFHTSEKIDFDLFENKDVAVLGAGASAMDNAVMALEAKASEVTVYCRRPELQRVQPFKWLSFPGFLRHFSELKDEWRWKFMSYLLTLREAFPKETWDRANRFKEFNIQTGAGWEDLRLNDERVAISTKKGTFEADFLIFGTGFSIDLTHSEELSPHAHLIALWSDKFKETRKEGEESNLQSYPYLGDGFQFLEKLPGSAIWLKNVHLFSFGATMSFGPSGASINAMKFAVPKLVNAITRDLFLEDIDYHFESMSSYNLPEFSLPGEKTELAPATTDFYGKKVGSK
tara:strand:+ start:961 stop:2442 length:1482 start_codon:yes stop_codon:yes gene_type:complete